MATPRGFSFGLFPLSVDPVRLSHDYYYYGAKAAVNGPTNALATQELAQR